MSLERVKGSFLSAVRSAFPNLPLFGKYRARIVAQTGQNFDVQPDADPNGNVLLPPMASLPLRNGLPGLSVTVAPGTYVLVGFMGGDRRLPYVDAWEGGETPIQVTLTSTRLNLGSSAASEQFVKGTTRNAAEQTFLVAMHTLVIALKKALNDLSTEGQISSGTQTDCAAAGTACNTFDGAITTFETAATAALSTTVYGS